MGTGQCDTVGHSGLLSPPLESDQWSLRSFFSTISCNFQLYFVSLPPEWEGPARQKKRYAPNLRNENVGNFQSKADNSRRAQQLPRICVGLFSYSCYRVSYDPRSGTGKAVPRFCYVVEQSKTKYARSYESETISTHRTHEFMWCKGISLWCFN